jgi:hypothetical protein
MQLSFNLGKITRVLMKAQCLAYQMVAKIKETIIWIIVISEIIQEPYARLITRAKSLSSG